MIILGEGQVDAYCENCSELIMGVPFSNPGRIFGLKCPTCGHHNVISQHKTDFVTINAGMVAIEKILDRFAPVVHYNSGESFRYGYFFSFETREMALKEGLRDIAGDFAQTKELATAEPLYITLWSDYSAQRKEKFEKERTGLLEKAKSYIKAHNQFISNISKGAKNVGGTEV